MSRITTVVVSCVAKLIANKKERLQKILSNKSYMICYKQLAVSLEWGYTFGNVMQFRSDEKSLLSKQAFVHLSTQRILSNRVSFKRP